MSDAKQKTDAEILAEIERSGALDDFMNFVDSNPAFTRDGWIEAIEAERKRQQGEA